MNIGQFTEALRSNIEAEDRYKDFTLSGDVIELLKLIKNQSYSCHSNKYLPQAIHKALHKLYTTSIDNSASCSGYLEKFQTVVDVIRSIGRSIGNNPELATKALKGMGMIEPSS